MNTFEMNTSQVEVFRSYRGGYGIIPRTSRVRVLALNRFLKRYSVLEEDAEPVFFCTDEQIEECLRILGVDERFIASKRKDGTK